MEVELSVGDIEDDLMGYYDHAARRVTMARGLTQVERRCTAAHEYVHALRGDLPTCSDWHEHKQETAVHVAAARLLLPVRDLIRALRWTDDLYELADELWVDVDTLRTRLRHLDPDERRQVMAARADRYEHVA